MYKREVILRRLEHSKMYKVRLTGGDDLEVSEAEKYLQISLL